MSKHFRPWNIDQTLLLPPSVQDFVPKDHVSRFIVGLVRRGRFSAERYHSHADRQFHTPRRQDAALRRRQEGWQGTSRDCNMRHGADQLSRGPREPAGFTVALNRP